MRVEKQMPFTAVAAATCACDQTFSGLEEALRLLFFVSGKIELQLIDVAITPVFPWLEGAHDGMFGGMKVLGSVFVFG
jgi:hypothetical protein